MRVVYATSIFGFMYYIFMMRINCPMDHSPCDEKLANKSTESCVVHGVYGYVHTNMQQAEQIAALYCE